MKYRNLYFVSQTTDLICASAFFIGSGISSSGCGVTAFVPKGSTITTGLYDTYYLSIVGIVQ